jgi:hypothetical protein
VRHFVTAAVFSGLLPKHAVDVEYSRSVSPRQVEPVHQPGEIDMKCRTAVPAALAVFTLCTVSGCRLGGTSGMTSWFPGQTSTLAGEDELAEAPRFDGEVVKPSAVATPYPTTSTPQGYVVPEAAESVSAPQLAATSPVPAATASMARTPPVTYGMKPAEVQIVSGAAAPQGPSSQASLSQLAGDSIAPQEGPYAPLAPTGPEEPVMPPPDTVASGFGAAGGTSVGPYPPEAAVGLAPAASAASSFSSPPAVQEQTASAFGATPSGGVGFPRPPAAAEPAAEERAPFVAEAAAAPASAGPTMSAFGQQAAVPAGAASESPVAGARYASAGNSRFGSAPSFEPPAAASGPESYGMPPTGRNHDLQVAEEMPVSPPASAAAEAYASPVEPPQSNFESGTAYPASAGFGSQRSSQPTQRPGRRADPMYRPAGTSSYEPAKPFFSDEPEEGTRVQMATFEEPVAMPFPQ